MAQFKMKNTQTLPYSSSWYDLWFSVHLPVSIENFLRIQHALPRSLDRCWIRHWPTTLHTAPLLLLSPRSLSQNSAMDINFEPVHGDGFQIEIGYFDTVLEIKEKIQKLKAIPVSKQTLVFNGNVLQDELNIHHSNILDQSRIQLLIAGELPQTKIRLLVKTPSSKSGITIEMDVKETIKRLKEKIQEMEGVPINKLIIHANGVELNDGKSVQDCELSDNSEVEVSFRSAALPVGTTSSGSSGSMGSGSRKLRIIVVTRCGKKRVPIEVNSWDNVGEMKKILQSLNEQLQLDLPQEGYFFIYKQNVMDDDRSFRWHQVGQGDTIEIFNGSISGGP